MAEERQAWLFDFGANLRAVVGGQHLAEYLRAPRATEVPLTPAHTRGVLVWRKRLLPLLDLARLAGEYDDRDPMGAIVLAYRETSESPLQYGALALASAPRELSVRDELVSELPTEPKFWRDIAASCITHENQPVPILRVRSIFTQAFAEPGALNGAAVVPVGNGALQASVARLQGLIRAAAQ